MLIRIINIALGIWLMSAPALLNYQGAAKNISIIIGALTTSLAIVACWQIMRSLRWANLAFGITLICVSLVMGFKFPAIINNAIAAVLLAGCAFSAGKVEEDKFGGGWPTVLKLSNWRKH
jgi:hypothetical protein